MYPSQGPSQFLHHSQRPVLTAHLAQTMALLSLTTDELHQQIEKELASNPALELVEGRRCPTCHRPLPDQGSCPVCSQPQNLNPNEPVVFVSPQEDLFTSPATNNDDYPEDYTPTEVENLPEYVLKQIGPDLDAKERRLAAFMLTHLNDDGLLTIDLMEAAQYLHVPLSQIQKIQKIIQRADPLGVGSRTTREALLVQLEILAESRPVPELAHQLVDFGMEELTRRQFSDLAHRYNTTLHKIQQAVRFIGENLNPFPARSHWGDVRQPAPANGQVYHRPDIIISYLNDDPANPLAVEIMMPLRGTLRVNPLFRQAIQKASEEKKDDWRNDYERASLFVKCLQQRNHTMLRLLGRVVGFQKKFILNGEKYLIPITRAVFAHELEVHESTISRAVSNKTVQLPNRRIIPLSSFFDRSLNVRTVLREIIDQESRPLSDSQLVDLLSKHGYMVARRTVAKYRAMEGILPAHLRDSVIR
jgi:RNA polymerase sigma-54 factor